MNDLGFYAFKFYDWVKDTPFAVLYDAFEFSLFIIPRSIQFVLGGVFELGWMRQEAAMGLYVGLTYLGAIGLLGLASRQVRRCVWKGALVIGPSTAKPLAMTVLLLIWAIFTALAPEMGLSIRECTKAIASFVTFGY